MDGDRPGRPYESDVMSAMTGETLRPGGFALTDLAVRSCGFSQGDAVLDIGCGRGATVRRLGEKYGIRAVGIDPSEKLVAAARADGAQASIKLGRAEALPFGDGCFDGVFAECSLSLADDLDAAVREAHRVLKDNGWFIIADVCARQPEALDALRCYPAGSCLRGMHNVARLEEVLKRSGFSVELLEDHSRCLTGLFASIIFSYGSLRDFWQATNALPESCADGDDYYQKMKQCKPGYFLLTARKKGGLV